MRTAELRVIVAAVIVANRQVLAGERTRPPEFAGLWEFPGGLVEPGESEPGALERECLEELAVHVTVAGRIGPDVPIVPGKSVLHVYQACIRHGTLRLRQHRQLRWLTAADLLTTTWLPADAVVVPDVAALLQA